MATVTEMKQRTTTEAKSEIAVGTVMEFKIGDGASSLQLSSCFGRDDDLSVWNEVLDKMAAAGARQAAKADILAFEQGIVVQEREMKDAQDLYERAERAHQEMIVTSDERVKQYQLQKGAVVQEDRDDFARSDKRGDYKPSGGLAARVRAVESQISHELEQRAKAESDREHAHKNHEPSLRSFTTKIDWYRSEIVRLKASIAE